MTQKKVVWGTGLGWISTEVVSEAKIIFEREEQKLANWGGEKLPKIKKDDSQGKH